MELPNNILYRLCCVRKTYSTSEAGQAALHIEQLDIPKNKVVAILGESGSGKTTLLNMLGMLDVPDATCIGSDGTPHRPSILFNARRDDAAAAGGSGCYDLIDDRAMAQRQRKQSFGFVFQEGYLLGNLTSAANISIPLFINGLIPDNSPLDRFLDGVDLPASLYRDRLPDELSGGEAQRIAIIRSMVHNPHVIIADEPASRLDSKHGRQVMQLLTGWCHGKEDRSLLWVTHNRQQADDLAEHIITLHDGRVVSSCANPLNESHGRQQPSNAAPLSLDHTPTPDASSSSPVCTHEDAAARAAQPSWRDIPTVPAKRPWLHTIRFILFFAIADIFSSRTRHRCSSPAGSRHGSMRLSQALASVRRTQGLNILSLFMILLLAYFFSNAAFWMKNYFVWSVSHPKINNITVNGKKHGDAVLSLADREMLASLAWVDTPNTDRRIVSWNQTLEQQGASYRQPAVIGAFGSRDRLLDCYADDNSDAALGWNNLLPLDLVAMDVRDPMLDQIELLGAPGSTPTAGVRRHVTALFQDRNGQWLPARSGIVLTRESLEKDLGYTGAAPPTIRINFNSRDEELPLLGVTDWLPFSAGAMVSAGWYEARFLHLGPGDPIPGYDRITIYIKDMLSDGLPVANELDAMGLQTTDNIRNRLTWIKNLTDFIAWFAVLTVVGIAILVAGTLMVSYTQAIQKKQKEIGVLLAHGIRKGLLHAIFLTEISIVWLIAVLLALPLHRIGSRMLQRFMVDKFALDGATMARVFQLPGYLPWLIGACALLLAWLSVGTALNRTIQGQIAAILKTAD